MADDDKWIPRPDPTELTTEALTRETGALKALMDARMESIEQHVYHLKELLERTVEERFRSIDTQFRERDTRTEQMSRDSKVAVDAALTAQKEAVSEQNKSAAQSIAKSETATGKQIDQMATLVTTTSEGINSKIDDVKERVTRIESEGGGKKSAHEYNMSIWAIMISVGALVAMIVGLFMHGSGK